MRCPDCGAAAKVIDSRPQDNGVIYRRWRCPGCRGRYSTAEIPWPVYRALEITAGHVRRAAAALDEIPQLTESR